MNVPTSKNWLVDLYKQHFHSLEAPKIHFKFEFHSIPFFFQEWNENLLKSIVKYYCINGFGANYFSLNCEV